MVGTIAAYKEELEAAIKKSSTNNSGLQCCWFVLRGVLRTCMSKIFGNVLTHSLPDPFFAP